MKFKLSITPKVQLKWAIFFLLFNAVAMLAAFVALLAFYPRFKRFEASGATLTPEAYAGYLEAYGSLILVAACVGALNLLCGILVWKNLKYFAGNHADQLPSTKH